MRIRGGNHLKDFQKNGLIMVVLTTLASGINYICQIGLGRVMSVSSFGVMNSLFSLILVLSVPGTSVNMIAARQIAQCADNAGACALTIYQLRRVSLCIGSFLLCGIVLLSIPMGAILDTTPVMVVLAGLAATLSFFPSLISGVLTGKAAFWAAGIFSLIVPLVKVCGILAAGGVLAEEVKQLVVMSAVTFGNIVAVLIAWRVLFPSAAAQSPDARHSHMSIPGTMLAVNFLYLLLGNGDIFLVVTYFGTEKAGIYSAAMLFGKILFFFTTAVVSVLLPYISKASGKGEGVSPIFRSAFAVTLAVSVVGFLPFNLFPTAYIRLLYGANYIEAAPLVPYSCAVAIFASLLNLELNCFVGMGKERRMLVHLSIALAGLMLLSAVCHTSVPALLAVLAAVLGILVAIELPACLRGQTIP